MAGGNVTRVNKAAPFVDLSAGHINGVDIIVRLCVLHQDIGELPECVVACAPHKVIRASTKGSAAYRLEESWQGCQYI